MKVTDFNLLKKFMNMTESGSDQEVLTAIRRANGILEKSGTTWDKVFNRLVSLEVEPEPQPSNVRTAVGRQRYLEDLLDAVEPAASGTFVDFVASLREQFERTGDLSAGQVEALEKSRARNERHVTADRRWR